MKKKHVQFVEFDSLKAMKVFMNEYYTINEKIFSSIETQYLFNGSKYICCITYTV